MLYTHVCTDLLAHAIRLLSVNRAECGGIDIPHIGSRLSKSAKTCALLDGRAVVEEAVEGIDTFR